MVPLKKGPKSAIENTSPLAVYGGQTIEGPSRRGLTGHSAL